MCMCVRVHTCGCLDRGLSRPRTVVCGWRADQSSTFQTQRDIVASLCDVCALDDDLWRAAVRCTLLAMRDTQAGDPGTSAPGQHKRAWAGARGGEGGSSGGVQDVTGLQAALLRGLATTYPAPPAAPAAQASHAGSAATASHAGDASVQAAAAKGQRRRGRAAMTEVSAVVSHTVPRLSLYNATATPPPPSCPPPSPSSDTPCWRFAATGSISSHVRASGTGRRHVRRGVAAALGARFRLAGHRHRHRHRRDNRGAWRG